MTLHPNEPKGAARLAVNRQCWHRAIAFGAGFILLAIAHSAVQFKRPAKTFDAAQAGPLYLDGLPVELVFDLKAGVSKSPFDIGLFGNSRSLPVSRNDLGLPQCSFFNYSIGGSSFRSSVALLDRLTVQKAAPRIAIINFDHLELKMMGVPDHLPLGSLVRMAAADVWAVYPDPRALLRALWRHAYSVWAKVRRHTSSKAAVSAVQRLFWPDAEIGQAYGNDGSRAVPVPGPGVIDTKFPAGNSAIDKSILIADFERLVRLRDSPGGPERIVIYESPVHPMHAKELEQSPSPGVRHLREVVGEVCKRHAIDCYMAGSFVLQNAGAHGWSDATHPPAHELGELYRQVLGQGLRCKGGPP